MGDWNRTTRECTLENIKPEMKVALDKHLEIYNLGPIVDDYLMGVETTSEKKKKGLFGGGGKCVIEVDFITPQWLVMVVLDDQPPAAVLSATLNDAQIEDYGDTLGYKYLPDSGLNISGVFTGRVGEHGSRRISRFLPLGEDSVGKRFKEMVFQAFQATRK